MLTSCSHVYGFQTVHTSNALVGTCKMGLKSDHMSVVGADLRVHGLKGKNQFAMFMLLLMTFNATPYEHAREVVMHIYFVQ